jgi:uncharacterized membrane protein YedE/YeeE
MTVCFTLGAAAGFVMHRADFCMAGALRDLFLFRSAALLRPLLLLVAVSMALTAAARHLGLLSVYPFPFLAAPSLANVAGGFLFGIGMVLAGGCVVGILYKLGAGSPAAAVGLAGLLAGSGLYAELHPWWSRLAQATTFCPGKVTLPQALGTSEAPWSVALAVAAAWLFRRWQRAGRWRQQGFAEGYLQPWLAAVLLAGIGLASSLLVGMPLGVTTSYSKAAAWAEAALWPQHASRLAYFAQRSLDYTAPLGRLHLSGGPGPGFDGVAVIQYPLIAGIVLGSACSALRLGELRRGGRLPVRQAVAVAVGGVLMGLASRMTPGCNIWHLWGGLPILALQSLLFVAGLFPGTWVGCRLLARLVLAGDSRSAAKPDTEEIN